LGIHVRSSDYLKTEKKEICARKRSGWFSEAHLSI